MKQFSVAVLTGDGIGPEVVREALKVLRFIGERGTATFDVVEVPFGAGAYFEHGHPFPEQTVAACDAADAILKGPVGLAYEQAIKIPADMQPERAAVLPLRSRYNTFANLRPVKLPASLAVFSPLKPEVIKDGIDILMIRELLGGLYFGKKVAGVDDNGLRYVEETLRYDETQIRQVVEVAFQQAMKRKKRLHNIHKSNILRSSILWNEIVDEVARDYPEVEVIQLLVDATTTHLCLNPCQFDVMVMENMFGDILSDQGGGLIGSLGLMPSACVGDGKAYYEPAHGSAPDIAGRDLANPYSMIGSVAMMLEHSFGMVAEADAIWQAMYAVFESGSVTVDLAAHMPGAKVLGTEAFGDAVIQQLLAMNPS
jgi:3-isopropylmalate dehydrogenase